MSQTLKDLAEQGYTNLNLQEIAQSVGTSKQAIYRRWPDKRTLAIEAVRLGFRQVPPVPPISGSLQADLNATLLQLATSLFEGPLGRAFLALLSEPSLRQEAQYIEGEQRTLMRQLFVFAGQTEKMEDQIDALLGPIYFRCAIRGQKVETRFIYDLVRNTLS
ncbi:TetR/AcrR family transcriptional regulator [Flexibacterium corallicola]|uniref:TetR/AcrR family transcriptional regulator n=1 Tax=Flexibacterium corallicola TaxID=3037259 RepID=UPI00286EDD2C|nr:TetR/AcrR family transcriptional regulator [Pseudovibrio sp. M1P-2-3]